MTKVDLEEISQGILRWYPFKEGTKALFVSHSSAKYNNLVVPLQEKHINTDILQFDNILSLNEQNMIGYYDYIILADAFELANDREFLLNKVSKYLKDTGVFLLCTSNRLGIRYFCGDRDPHTGRNFDGIENYRRANDMMTFDSTEASGRLLSKSEITNLLLNNDFKKLQFHSVFPGIDNPQIIIADDYTVTEDLSIRIFPTYNNPDSVFLEEEPLYTTLIENNMFHNMANAFFVECAKADDACFANSCQVTISPERGKVKATATIICKDNSVKKKALYKDGEERIQKLLDNQKYLEERGVNMVSGRLIDNEYIMPVLTGVIGYRYLKELAYDNCSKFIDEIEKIKNIIYSSSKYIPYEAVNWQTFEPGWEKRKADDPDKFKWEKIALCGSENEKKMLGPILERGYMDLVPLNCFYNQGEYIFFDQEEYLECVPANAIFYRVINDLYGNDTLLAQKYPRKEMLRKFGLLEYETLWNSFASKYLDELRDDTNLKSYHDSVRRDISLVNSNRQRMNYSQSEYKRLFEDIFRNVEYKDLYIFGSGNFAKKFISQFGKDYRIKGVFDNNQSKWGGEFSGITIQNPEELRGSDNDKIKVIICIKNYLSVVKQLREIGVKDIAIYDWNLEYERKIPQVSSNSDSASQDSKDNKSVYKKYHVGYVAGVFDLFHIGHLNMFKRAKEQCDYLIVGVVTDEQVLKTKRTTPYIPFEERLEIVKSCRYVDEVVEIPPDYADTKEAFRRYHFDVQFSGSDYANDPAWLAQQHYLRKHGSDLVFFPYTETTSSTQIKNAIRSGKTGNEVINENNN